MSEELFLTLHATRRDLADALSRIEHFCAFRNLPRATAMRLLVVIEELFTNTIKYGYGSECAKPVRIALREGNPVSLIYEDDAAAFDPTRWESGVAPGGEVDGRPVGQAGLPLVLGLASSARYERRGDTNRLALELPA